MHGDQRTASGQGANIQQEKSSVGQACGSARTDRLGITIMVMPIGGTTSGGTPSVRGVEGASGSTPGQDAVASAATELSLGRRIGRWVANAISVSVGLSLAVHVAMIALAAMMSVGIGGGVAGRGGDRRAQDYELTTSDAELTSLGDAPLDSEAPPAAMDTELPDVPTAGILEGQGGTDAPGAGPGLGAIADGLGGAGGGDVGDGAGLGAGGSGGGGASFFGVEAQGTRFAYIVDVSGSMAGDKLAALKLELTGSIGGMLEHMSYFVVCFSSMPQPLAERRKWTDATDDGKRWATAQLQKLSADGGTQPWGAFELVLTMKPAPDAIYFMTDGQFDAAVADQIAVRNRGARKVPIHCISFVDNSAEELMRRIAGQSGGTYTHVKGPR